MKMITDVNEVKLTENEYDVFLELLWDDITTLDKISHFLTNDGDVKPHTRNYFYASDEIKEKFLTLFKTTFESNIFLLKEWIKVNCRTKVKISGYVNTYVSYEKFVYNDGKSPDELDVSEIYWNMDDLTDVECVSDPEPDFDNEEILEIRVSDYTKYVEYLEKISV